MKKITVLTATRSEYSLLGPVIHALINDGGFDVRVVATGAHLSPEFGLTYREIEQDGVEIHKKIEILLSADTPSAISKSMGMAMIGFADYFAEYRPDALLVLGDRYETLAVCCAAMNERIPIIHLYGGETTEGAVDEAVRHAVTKLSYLHLTSTEGYRRRVIQLGESPDRVFAVGAIGVENAMKQKLMEKNELEQKLKWKLNNPYVVVTFHPVTLENNSAVWQCKELLSAMDSYPEMQFIITKANADGNGRIINHLFEIHTASRSNMRVYDSLGMSGYLSALKYARMVVGNSSSGLVEAPSFRIPTVDIGDRQKGRLKAASVIHCNPAKNEIIAAMAKANSESFRQVSAKTVNPYGDGNASKKIVEAISGMMVGNINIKKKFYDIKVFV